MRTLHILTLLVAASTFAALPANAMKTEEFLRICESIPGECSESPYIQAYVGGALDFVAVLDEESDYLSQIYCEDPRSFFDVPAIIRFMESNGAGHEQNNAMLLVLRYLEEHGGC